MDETDDRPGEGTPDGTPFSDGGCRGASATADAQAVAAVRRGEVARFAELLDRHEARVRAVVGRTLRDRELVADAVQHAFFLALRHLESLAEPRRFEAWLVRIATRVAEEAGRRRARERARSDGDERLADAVARPPADGAIWEEVARLTPLLREALQLRYRDGLSYEEIAARLDVPLSTVRGRIHEARKALRRRLEEGP